MRIFCLKYTNPLATRSQCIAIHESIKTLVLLLLSLFSMNAYAIVTCQDGSICGQIINLTITKNLTSTENQVGYTVESNQITTTETRMHADEHATVGEFITQGDGPVPPPGNHTDWYYEKLDDYISIALRYEEHCETKPVTHIYFAPFNVEAYDLGFCKPNIFDAGSNNEVNPKTYTSRIRIDKRMVTGTYSKNILLGQFGRNQPYPSVDKQLILNTIYLSLNITVPEQCIINSGNIVEVGFNEIPANKFNTAGSKPDGINPKTRTIDIKCTSIDAYSNLTIRVLADQAVGNAIISDNPDVGFVIADHNNKQITPNNTSSTIPFQLDDKAAAQVPINIWPISITGKIPEIGPVKSVAWLQIDFD